MDNPSSFLFTFAAATALFVIPSFAAGAEVWQSRPPMQDTFVRDTERNNSFATNLAVIVGNNREGCMMFDVAGLANVTAARIRFYLTQCGTTSGVKWPLFFRIMRNDQWADTTLTWNSLPDEFRVAWPLYATNDVTLAGYVEIPAGSQGTWQTVDVTEAVKAAAPRGRLALHITSSWDGNGSSDTTPICFAASDHTDKSLCPVLEFQGEEMGLRLIEDAFIEKSNPNSNFGIVANEATRSGAIVVERGAREGFMKFDISGFSGTPVDSAKLRVRTNFQAETGNTVQFQIVDDNWSEGTVTWNNPPSGVTPGAAWSAETPQNAIRAASPGPDMFHDFELAPLVNQALAAGKTTMSLHITIQNSSPRFFICSSKERDTAAWRPRIMTESFADAPLTTRTPLQETFVGSNQGDTAYLPWMMERNWNYLQIGCDGNMAQYGLMLFDPTGLEDAEYVRLRVRVQNTIAPGDGGLRVAAWTTDAWNATNLTYNTVRPWFPSVSSVTAATALDGEIASVYFPQARATPYIEVDVTAAARAAAQAGRMVTFGLFSNRDWPTIYMGESPYPAVLIFPDPDATFGKRVTCSLDRSGGSPALKLAWSPSAAAGATYTVERQKDGTWKTVATDLSEATCLDARAEPNVAQTYRITETTSGKSVVKSVTLVPTVRVFACADTYVRNGGDANATFGTGTSIVHKYSGYNDGATREGLYRFDLSEIPADFDTAIFKLYSTGVDDSHDSSAHVNLYVYPDFDWTDETAPTWNAVFSNGWPTQRANTDGRTDAKRAGEVSVGQFDVTSRFVGADEVSFDVTSAIRAARAAGASHITLHSASYCGSGNWNFGFIPRERSQGISLGPQIVFTLKNWVPHGMVIMIR